MGLVELKNCRYRIFNDYGDHYNELRYNNFKKYGQFVHEINNDIGHVFSFLNSIYQDMPGAIDKYNLIGETDDYVQVLNYIDSLYKSSKKMVKVIK